MCFWLNWWMHRCSGEWITRTETLQQHLTLLHLTLHSLQTPRKTALSWNQTELPNKPRRSTSSSAGFGNSRWSGRNLTEYSADKHKNTDKQHSFFMSNKWSIPDLKALPLSKQRLWCSSNSMLICFIKHVIIFFSTNQCRRAENQPAASSVVQKWSDGALYWTETQTSGNTVHERTFRLKRI